MGRASAALLDAYPSAALTLLEPDEGRLALVAERLARRGAAAAGVARSPLHLLCDGGGGGGGGGKAAAEEFGEVSEPSSERFPSEPVQ
jgi:hypothetical protein